MLLKTLRSLCMVVVISLPIHGVIAFWDTLLVPFRETPQIRTCFAPKENCTPFIVEAIASSKKSILVQAYGFTNEKIVSELAYMKERYKIEVQVILDESNTDPRYRDFVTHMRKHNIPVFIDHRVAIAHNKVMIIDNMHVITGSFNFTESADKRNAENVVLLKNNHSVARAFTQNWHDRLAVSKPYSNH